MKQFVIRRNIFLAAMAGLFVYSDSFGACDSLDDLKWMFSDWELRTEDSLVTESWRRVSPKTAEGRGRVYSVPDFRISSSESMRLASMAGEIFYTAKVAHNEFPVSFRLTSCSEKTAVFENPSHDFPTRVAYEMTGPGTVSVDVSGLQGDGFSLSYGRGTPRALRRIALTFDDAPRSDTAKMTGAERTRNLIRSLASADSPPVIFFSTAKGIDEAGDARMRAYQDAGHTIGNHSFSHQRIHRIGVDAYIADIQAAHQILAGYENFVPLFRFPFLDEGRDAETRDTLRNALKEMGYRNGYVTVDNYDFHMDSLLQAAVKQGREVNFPQLGKAYVEALMRGVRFYADMADRHLDRPPVHTLLLHENDLAALYVDDLIRALRNEGWTLVDAVEAFEDPIADVEPDTLFNNQGRVAAIAATNGASLRDLVHPLEDTAQLELMFEEFGAFGAPNPPVGEPGVHHQRPGAPEKSFGDKTQNPAPGMAVPDGRPDDCASLPRADTALQACSAAICRRCRWRLRHGDDGDVCRRFQEGGNRPGAFRRGHRPGHGRVFQVYPKPDVPRYGLADDRACHDPGFIERPGPNTGVCLDHPEKFHSRRRAFHGSGFWPAVS